MKYPLSSPSITALEKRYVNEALDAGWISGTGEFVTRFEQALAEKVQRKHCIAVSNGTDALELALLALSIGPGDEVIVPALTFVAPAAAVAAVGAQPVFADVYGNTWCISAWHVEHLITPKTKAIIAVDLLGQCAGYDHLKLVAGDIPIIEDAAEAHGAEYHDRPAGSFGVISTFSTHANKVISTGEGGAVLTDSAELAITMRLIANHGMSPARPYWHDVVGHNYRLTNITAAIGLAQVERWDELVERRRQIFAWYDENLLDLIEGDSPLWRRPSYRGELYAEGSKESPWLYTLWHLDRQPIIAHLRSCGIDARAIWTPLCDLPLYKDACRTEYEFARRIGYGAFWLPTHAGMSEDDVKYICEKVREALR